MAGPVAHLVGFGGGVVKEGAADTQRTDELQSCDAYDIGPRGALIAARDVADYVTVNDLATVPVPLTAVHALRSVAGNNFTKEIVVGEGLVVATKRYLLGQFTRESAATPVTGATYIKSFSNAIATRAEGVLVTVAQFPGVYAVTNAVESINVFLINIGAREGFAANVAPGLYVAYTVPPASEVVLLPISSFDALGTGTRGEKSAGTQASQLYFRGISAYNAHGIGWGFDANGGTDKEGPARLMFANLNKPLKWGNDNVGAVGTDRLFTDSDAITVGDGGEIIRAGLTWNSRFWIGTDKQVHYLAGNGRDSFVTDGANPVAKAENVLGPHCLIEGPNRQLFGVGDQGLWEFDGSTFENHHRRLRDFAGQSKDWWELIWTDRARSDTYPGKTNGDLVWLHADWENEQIVVGIPFCDASAGRGYGLDTVLIKFSVRTGGFTRQVFSGVQYTAADYPRRQRQYATSRFFGTATSGQATVKKYGDPLAATGAVASTLPKVQAGPYALYGPDGVGVYRKAYVTLAWELGGSGAGLTAWQSRTTPLSNSWSYVCYSPELALFVATACDLGAQNAMTSLNGADWTIRATPAGCRLGPVAWSPTLLKFVSASCDGGHTDSASEFFYSSDGIVWVGDGVAPAGRNWTGIAWSDALALFVAVADDGTVKTSANGIAWTTRAAPVATWQSVCWSAALAKFVAVAITGVGGAGVDMVMTSSNGTAWTIQNASIASAWTSVCWADTLGLLVAVARGAGSGTNRVMTSPDGATWTTRVAAADQQYFMVAWSHEAGKLVAVAASGASRVMTSTDGITWTGGSSADDARSWLALCWSAAKSRMVAVSQDGQVMTSDLLGAVPLVPDMRFKITPYIDDQALDAVRLSVKSTAPTTPTPVDGDVWLDVSASDTSIGNATAGTLVSAAADYLVKRRYLSAWQPAGVGGQKAQRVTVPIAFTPTRGTRISLLIEAESSNRRWQLEGLGLMPAAVTSRQ